MNISRALLVVAAAVTTTATGCAAAPVPEAKGRSHANEEIGAGGGGDAIFMKVDGNAIQYAPLDGTQGNVIVCASQADPGLVAQIQNAGATPYVVLQKDDGSYDSRVTDRPSYEQDTLACDGGGGPAYIFHLREQTVDFVNQDLSAAFKSGFSTENIDCDVGFTLSKGIDFDMQGMRVVNGKLQQPEFALRLEGDSSGAVSAHCSLHATTPTLVFTAGPVPVFYELEMGIGLTVSLSKASHLSAQIGTSGGRLSAMPADGADAPEITITPEVEFGVTFYGVVGGYVGIGFPITITPHPPCTPDVTMGAELTVGAQAGILGIADLPITKALSVEVSSPVLGPFAIATSTCPVAQ